MKTERTAPVRHTGAKRHTHLELASSLEELLPAELEVWLVFLKVSVQFDDVLAAQTRKGCSEWWLESNKVQQAAREDAPGRLRCTRSLSPILCQTGWLPPSLGSSSLRRLEQRRPQLPRREDRALTDAGVGWSVVREAAAHVSHMSQRLGRLRQAAAPWELVAAVAVTILAWAAPTSAVCVSWRTRTRSVSVCRTHEHCEGGPRVNDDVRGVIMARRAAFSMY